MKLYLIFLVYLLLKILIQTLIFLYKHYNIIMVDKIMVNFNFKFLIQY